MPSAPSTSSSAPPPPLRRREDLIGKLNSSSSTDTKLKALRDLKNQIIGNRTKKLFYLKLGAVPSVTAILSYSAANTAASSGDDVELNDSLIIQSSAAIGSFACGLDEGVKAVLDAGAFSILLRLISYPNDKVVGAAARSLKFVYQSKLAPKYDFLQGNNMEFIQSLLNSENENVTGLGASIITHSCQTFMEQKALSDAGIIKKLTCMLGGSVTQKDASLESLAAILKGNPDVISKFMEPENGVLGTVTELTKDKNARTKLLACICLIVIKNSSPSCLQDLQIKTELILILLELLEDDQVGDEAPFALSSLIAEKEDMQLSAFEENVIDKLVNHLRTGPLRSRRLEGILIALANMCSRLERCRDRLLSLEAMKFVSDALCQDSGEVRAAACMCLKTVSRSVKNLSAGLFMNESFVVPLVRLLYDDFTFVQVSALDAISNLVVDFLAHKTIFMQCGGVKQLVQLSKAMDSIIRVKAVCALRNLTFLVNGKCKEEILSELTQLTLRSLICDPEASVQEQALALTRNLVDGPVDSIQHVFAEDALLLHAVGQQLQSASKAEVIIQVTEQPAMLQGGELRPYQLEGLQWMLFLFNNNLNGILADEMGLGKTIQTISLIAYLMENKDVTGPHLIAAPKAVLPNWINEFSTWAPSIVAILYDGCPEERKALRDELFSGEGKFNVLITHYDLLMRDKKYLRKIHWHYLIIDEGHRLKNSECALSRIIVSNYRIRRRLLLTGTPIQNSLQELWALLNFLLPNIFNSVENFEEWFNAPFSDKCDVSLTDEEQLLVIRRLHQVIRPFILRRKKDEVEKYLPGKTQVVLKCDMSAWQKVYYKQVTDVGRVGLDTGTGKSKSLQNLTMQLRKCCNHPYLFVSEHNVYHKEEIVRASGKFELLDRLLPKLRRAGHRVLLFSQMTRLMDFLGIYLQLHDYKYLRLDGSTKTEERGTLLKQFNAPDSPYFMFLLSTRAGGLGLNLQTADTVIIFDSDWNPQMDQQAEDRAHRIGQKKEVRVFVLVSVGSIEEVILERAKQKMGIDAKVIQAGLFNNTSTAQERREMLEEIMRKGTSTLGTDVPTEREINRLAARSDEEFWLFEKMDEERRQKERYRSRLMEDHEVPDWAYATPDSKDKGKGFMYESANLTGKRRRKEVVYADTLSDLKWMKAVENGDDFFKQSGKGRNRDHQSVSNAVSNGVLPSDNTEPEKQEQNSKIDMVSVASEATSEDTFAVTPRRFKSESASSPGNDYHDLSGSFLDGLSWNAHRRKRSSLEPRNQFDQ